MYCKKCGQLNKDSARFCVKCGQSLENLQQPVPQKKKNPLFMIAVLVATVTFLLVLTCVILLIIIPEVKNRADSDSRNQEAWEYVTEENTRDIQETEEITEGIQDTEENRSGIQDTEEITEGKQDTASPESTSTSEQLYVTIEEGAEICRHMSKLKYTQNADKNLLSSMATAALQMERAKAGKGYSKKSYSNLQEDDQSILLVHILDGFATRQDITQLLDYDLYPSSGAKNLIRISAAEHLVKDFYGRENMDFSDFPYLEDQGDGFMMSYFGGGDPWYELGNYSVKENGDFYLLEGACFYGDNSGDMSFVGYAKYLFRKNEDSSLGVTLVYSEFDYETDVNLALSAEASSTLKPQEEKTYRASNLIDGNLNTCWVEGASGTGIGETITLYLGKKQTVYGLTILNGYLESKYLYGINGKVTQVSVSATDGTRIKADLMVPEFEEVKESFNTYEMCDLENWINFDEPVYTDTITVTIEGAEAGSKYEDTCISEIKVY